MVKMRGGLRPKADALTLTMNKNICAGLIIFLLFVVPAAFFLWPIESSTKKEILSGKVIQYIPSTVVKGTPAPYYRIKLSNGLIVRVEDYGVAKAKVGEKVVIQKYTGSLSGKNEYYLVNDK